MARVRLIHWNALEGRERKLRVVALGHQVDFDPLERLPLVRTLRANLPEVFLIDLSRLPSHGREVALVLRSSKDTRHVPIVFVDGDPEKVAQLKALLPDATYTSWGRLKMSLAKTLARPVTAPIVPPASIYSGKPLADKLGIKPNMRVCLLGAPKGFADMLAPLPAGVTLAAKSSAGCDLFVVFVRSGHELSTQLLSVARDVTRQTAWFAWPKKASGTRTDLDGNVVRETGLATGWVDFKVCSISDTWSGLGFKRRK
jgi:CheY-like chemotaxis protein